MEDISIYSLWKSGALDFVIKKGIIKSSIPEYCEIYEVYIKLRARGYNYTQAVESTAEKLSLTDSKVKVAIAQVI